MYEAHTPGKLSRKSKLRRCVKISLLHSMTTKIGYIKIFISILFYLTMINLVSNKYTINTYVLFVQCNYLNKNDNLDSRTTLYYAAQRQLPDSSFRCI